MSIGIYSFMNNVNFKRYIGQSSNIEHRKQSHINNSQNKNYKEYNSKLYLAFRKYGLEKFSFEIIEVLSDCSLLNEREKYWIDYYDSYKNGYNGNPGGDYITERGEGHPLAILTIQQVEMIKHLLFTTEMTQKEICEHLNISSLSTVSNINTGKHWKTVGNYDYPIRQSHWWLGVKRRPRTVLSNKQVMSIRERYVNETISQISKDYDHICSYTTIERVCIGKSYKHLPIYKKTVKKWINEPVSTIP